MPTQNLFLQQNTLEVAEPNLLRNTEQQKPFSSGRCLKNKK